jgi:phosphatidylserine/phosphatidylglycerophosphate/cardiolipin synthase-like enzyme
VVPILSPDNYMKKIPDFLASATKSISIEQQYIRSTQPEIRKLLGSIQTAMKKNPDMDVRIILALPYTSASKEEIASINGLKDFGLKMGKNIRFLNSRYFVHCHNKLIIVDGKAALISSQNWSDFAVMKNREAGILIFCPEIADYYTSIFNGDWETGLRQLPGKKRLCLGTGPETQGMMAVDISDYVEI